MATIGKNRPLINLLIVILCVGALISVVQGYRNALRYSQDFQWSPTVLLIRKGLDPYREFREHPEGGGLILSQIPTYSHFTYLLLSPFAFMNFELAKIVWAATNVLMASSVFLLLRKRFDDRIMLVVWLVFLASTPTRNVIGNGQQSLLCLFLYILATRVADNGSKVLASLIAGVGSFKFSFGVPLAFAFDTGRCLTVAAYAAPTLLGIVFWIVYFHSGVIEAISLPLGASQTAIGTGDLLSLLRTMDAPQTVVFGVPLMMLCIIVMWEKCALSLDDMFERVSFYAVISLLLFYHSRYDDVFLLPCLLVGIQSRSFSVRVAIALLVSYFWFGLKLLSLIDWWGPPIGVNHIVLWALFGALAYEGRTKQHDANSEGVSGPQGFRG
jgi:hypothetical protein